MSTRGMYVFKDKYEKHNVYKHYDNYPEGAAQWLANALSKAWELPRYEPDEFAAAFIAANKEKAGDVRLLKSGKWDRAVPGDVEYVYEIEMDKGNVLCVTSYSTQYNIKTDSMYREKLWSGPLVEFINCGRASASCDQS